MGPARSTHGIWDAKIGQLVFKMNEPLVGKYPNHLVMNLMAPAIAIGPPMNGKRRLMSDDSSGQPDTQSEDEEAKKKKKEEANKKKEDAKRKSSSSEQPEEKKASADENK